RVTRMPAARWPSREMVSCSVTHSSKQEFDISITTGDRRFDCFHDTPAKRGDKLLDIAADRGVHGAVAHDALFQCGAARLVLRLDQRNESCLPFGERECLWQHVLERYEADVDSDKIGRFVEQVRRKRADVSRFEQGDTGLQPQGFVQLAAADIDGVDTSRPTLEQ